jgi:hypothetical protein
MGSSSVLTGVAMLSRFFLRRFRPAALLRALFALAGAGMIWVATARYGPGLSADSAKYLSAAESFSRGRGFIEFDGKPLVEHPPLYPFAIAALHRISGGDLLRCARLLGAVVFGLTVWVFGCLAGRHFADSPLLASVAPLVALISAALFRVGVMAWTEPLFVLLVVVFLLLIEIYRDREGWRGLVVLAVVAGLSTLTRYLGVSLIAAGVAWLLLHHRAFPKVAAVRALAFALIASLPLGLWAARNHRIASTWLGPRDPASVGLSDNLLAVRAQLLYWFLPGKSPPLAGLRWGLVVLGFALLLFSLGGLWRRGQERPWRKACGPILPLAMFLSSYTLFLLGTAARAAFDAIDGRLISPLYLPLGLMLLVLGELTFRSFPLAAVARRASGILALLLGLWLIYPLRAIVLDGMSRIHDGAGGFNTATCQNSETLLHLRSHPPSASQVLYSNVPDILFALAGIRSRWTPERHGWNSSRPGPSLSQLEGTWPEAPALLVWFHAQAPDSFLYGLRDLQSATEMTLEESFSDGAIFSIAPRNARRLPGPAGAIVRP